MAPNDHITVTMEAEVTEDIADGYEAESVRTVTKRFPISDLPGSWVQAYRVETPPEFCDRVLDMEKRSARNRNGWTVEIADGVRVYDDGRLDVDINTSPVTLYEAIRTDKPASAFMSGLARLTTTGRDNGTASKIMWALIKSTDYDSDDIDLPDGPDELYSLLH
jgi:hypothetical protein